MIETTHRSIKLEKVVTLTVDENGRPLQGKSRYVKICVDKETKQLLLQLRRQQRQVQQQVLATLQLIDDLLDDVTP